MTFSLRVTKYCQFEKEVIMCFDYSLNNFTFFLSTVSRRRLKLQMAVQVDGSEFTLILDL